MHDNEFRFAEEGNDDGDLEPPEPEPLLEPAAQAAAAAGQAGARGGGALAAADDDDDANAMVYFHDVLLGSCADPNAAGELVVDTRLWLQVPGVFHSIHNACGELPKCMSYYNTFVKELKLVCDVVRRTYSRQRLISTCFSEPPAKNHKELYEGFSASVHKGRWGSVAEAVEAVGPLEPSLRQAWDA
eukprot:7735054-Pyramimonas_sp.AAC.1